MAETEQSSQHDGREAETCDVGPDGGGGESSSTRSTPGFRSRPDKIGNYKIKRAIASGGMGTVYEAVQEQPRRTVAVKVMKQGLASRSALRRFEYESQILARLRHPGIAAVFESGMHDDGFGGVPYFAMEYIAGAKDLFEYANAKNLGTRERLELFIKVCEAIHHGHQKGIIHRDLKPANILVDSTGQPKIIDFGVARATDSDLAVTTLQTDVGQLVGTVQYMSPEQIDADPHDIDTRSDVYALGVVLYKLLTKQLPYDVTGTVIYEATRMIREEKPQRVSSFDKTLKGDVETIVLHALEKDRDRRYQSAQELGLDIHRYLENRTILARPPSVTYQLKTFMRRNKVLVGAAAAVFVALIVGTIGTATGWRVAVARGKEEARLHEVAERRFEQVRKLAHTFMFDFHDKLPKIDGAIPARDLIVTSALKYLDTLAKDAGDNADLRLELAAGYDKVGDILGGVRNPSKNQTDEALASYRTALQLRQVAAELKPDDPDLRNDLGLSHMKVADILRNTGDVEGALAEYRQAQVFFDGLPTDDRRRSAALISVSNMFLRTGRISEARPLLQQAVQSRRDIVAILPADLAADKRILAQRDLTVALLALGNAENEGGEFAAAQGRFDEAIRIREEIQKADPNLRSRRDLAVARYFAGMSLVESDDPYAALEHLSFFLEVTEAATKENPEDGRLQRDFATALEAVGRAHLMLGDADAAEVVLRRFELVIVPLAEAAPDHTNLSELAATADLRLGELAEHGGARSVAVGHYRKCLDRIGALADAEPTNIQFQIVLADTQVRLGRLLGELGETDEAAPLLSAARGKLGGIAAQQPESAAIRKALVNVLVALSTLAAKRDDARAAATYAEDAVATSKRRDAESLRALAVARHMGGDDAAAAAATREAIALIEQGPAGGVGAAAQLRQALDGDLARYGR